MPFYDVHNNSSDIGITSITLIGKFVVDGEERLIYSATVTAGTNATFETGQFYHIAINGKASFMGGIYQGLVTAATGVKAISSGGAYQYPEAEDGGTAVVENSVAFSEDVTVVRGTLTVESSSFDAAAIVESDGTVNANSGGFIGVDSDKVTYGDGARKAASGSSFANLYLYGNSTA